MYGPKHLVFQLFMKVGTWICMDISIQFSNCSVEWESELRYAWTQPFSFSIAWGSGNLDMYGPKHLVYQLFDNGRGEIGYKRIYPNIQLFNCFGEWELRYVWTQPFSFSTVWQSGNFAMYRPSHLVFQLLGGVGTWICMDRSIQFINCSVGGGGNWIYGTRIYPNIQLFNCFVECELRYVWTHPFSFSIESWNVNLDMHGPKHSVFQLSRGV